jgi:hypothetical protein
MTAPRPIPQDHLKPAAQIEAEGIDLTTIEFDGHTFTIPTDPQRWQVKTLRAFNRGDPLEALPLLLGSDYDKAGIDDWEAVALNELAAAIAKAAGFESAGE